MKPAKKLNPLMLLPGTALWALIGIGAATGDQLLITIGVSCMAGAVVIGLARKAKQAAAKKQDQRRIWQTGVDALAKVVNIGSKGGGINDHPMIDFELDVLLPGKAPYRVEARALISQLAIPRVQPGSEISVRVDPNHPQRLVVDPALTPYGH